jgi:hypothetical protein
VPFPFVAVTLPADTPPAYVTGLLSACTQAYPEGACRTDSDDSPLSRDAAGGGSTVPAEASDAASAPAVGSAPETAPTLPDPAPSLPGAKVPTSSEDDEMILATVTWGTPTTATLVLGFPHWRNQRWISRSVVFKEQDQPLERYRALGFTIGSLAETVAEVARLEREARASEEPDPPDPTAAATVSVPPSPEKLPAVDVPLLDEAPRERAAQRPAYWFVRGYAAGEFGEGFDAMRRGGTLGVGFYRESWGGHVSGYYTDASGNGLSAAFAGIELMFDFRVLLQSVEAQLSLGGGYGHLDARFSKETSQDFPTAVMAVNFMPAHWVVAPYIGVGARMFRGFITDVPGLDHLGPITPFLHVGLALGSPGQD